MSASSHRAAGAALVFGAAFVFSLGGLIFRHIEGLDIWTINFWRALTMAIALAIGLAALTRGRVVAAFVAAGWRGLASGACIAVMMSCYMLALPRTTVANIMVIASAAPFLTALLAWFILRERPGGFAALCMAAAFGGIVLMVANDLGQGEMIGNALAVVMTVGMAVNVIIVRSAREASMLPAVIVGGVISTIVSAPLASFAAPLSAANIGLLLLLGPLQLGFGLALYVAGARRLKAAETTMIAMVESVLAPLWVWLAVSERPSTAALIGGAFVLGAVVALTIWGARRAPAPTGADGVPLPPAPAGSIKPAERGGASSP
jgi:drug/metabolite transporter (DMT)-like permease